MNSYTSLGQAEAQAAIAAIQAELIRRGQAAVIAVADAHGELIGLLRRAIRNRVLIWPTTAIRATSAGAR